MNRIIEAVGADLQVLQALNNTNVDGIPKRVNKVRTLLAIMLVTSMAATKTATIKWKQATSAAKAGAKDVSGSSKAMTANTLVKAGTIALATADEGDIVVVKVTGRDGNVVSSGNLVHTTDFTTAATLDAAIEGSDVGDYVTVTNASTTVTVAAKDGYALTLEATNVGGTVTLATTLAMVMSEISVEDLDTDNDFVYAYPNFATTANVTMMGGLVLDGDSRHIPIGQSAPYVLL